MEGRASSRGGKTQGRGHARVRRNTQGGEGQRWGEQRGTGQEPGRAEGVRAGGQGHSTG